MWVKKTSYKRLQEERDYLRDAYQDMVRMNDATRWERDSASKRVKEIMDEVVELKRKYADEVQKRLVLIEQMKKREENE